MSASEELRTVGKSVERVDARLKATGEVRFCADITLPAMLHAKVKRSHLPHARILRIDFSKAAKIPGVKGIITGEADAPYKHGIGIADEYFLARDVVRMVGEPVAAVAAERLDIAEEAMEKIKVEYRELTPVFDPEEAMSTNPPAILHQDLAQDIHPYFDVLLDPERPNVFQHARIYNGDVEQGFRESDIVMENRYTTGMINHAALEPHAFLAEVSPDGMITIWSTNQAPHMAQDAISQALGIPAHRIRVITPYLGGGFGGKLEIRGEPICAALAMKTKRPVKLVYSREEVFWHTTVRHPFVIYVKDGVMKDGRILARQVRYILNSGAYAGCGHWVPKYTAFSAVNSYNIPNIKVDAYAVYTNQMVGGAFRGFGCSQSLWALESQMDDIAHRLGMNPVELRRKNLLNEGDYSAAGEKMQAVGTAECLEKAARGLSPSKIEEKPGPDGWVRGRGLALAAIMSVAPTLAGAHLRVFDDGSLEVRTGATEHGQGAHTVLSQIAAEEFGIAVEKVRVIPVDTLISPIDMGAVSSRQTFNSGNAVRMACKEAKRQLFDKAAQKMEASPDDLETRDGKIFVRGAPSKAIGIKDIFSPMFMAARYYRDGGELMGKAVWNQPADRIDKETGRLIPGGRVERASAFHMPAAQAVEVEVNINTGQVRVVKFIGINDVGRAINPVMVEGQIGGGMGMGIGSALFEEMACEGGNLLNPSFMDYKLPTAVDMPLCDETLSLIVEVPMPTGPFGAKGVGEAVMVAVAPAIGNAIYDAVGVRITELPITPEKVLRAIREKQRSCH